MSNQEAADDESIQLPLSDKQLAACKVCRRVLTENQFMTQGCESGCFDGGVARADLEELVTNKFSGYVGIIDAKNSWVARLIGCKQVKMGMYSAHIDVDEDGDDEDGDDV